VRLYAGDDILLGKFVVDVQNIEFGSAAVLGSLLEMRQLFFLTAVDAYADNVEVIVLFEPGNDGCGIETAAIGEDYFFFLFGHLGFLHFSIFILIDCRSSSYICVLYISVPGIAIVNMNII
jgi:hypothetical protein